MRFFDNAYIMSGIYRHLTRGASVLASLLLKNDLPNVESKITFFNVRIVRNP